MAIDDADHVLKYNIKCLADFCSELSLSHLSISSDLKIMTTGYSTANVNKSSKNWVSSSNRILNVDNIISNEDKSIGVLLSHSDVHQDAKVKVKKLKRKKRHKTGKEGDGKKEVMVADRIQIGEVDGTEQVDGGYYDDGFDSDNCSAYDEKLSNENIPEIDSSTQQQQQVGNQSSLPFNFSMITHDPLALDDAFDMLIGKNGTENDKVNKKSRNIFCQNRNKFTNGAARDSDNIDNNIDNLGYNDTVISNIRNTFSVVNQNRNHWIAGRAVAPTYLKIKDKMKSPPGPLPLQLTTLQRSGPTMLPTSTKTDTPEFITLHPKFLSKRDLPPFNIFPCQFCVQYFRGKGE